MIIIDIIKNIIQFIFDTVNDLIRNIERTVMDIINTINEGGMIDTQQQGKNKGYRRNKYLNERTRDKEYRYNNTRTGPRYNRFAEIVEDNTMPGDKKKDGDLNTKIDKINKDRKKNEIEEIDELGNSKIMETLLEVKEENNRLIINILSLKEEYYTIDKQETDIPYIELVKTDKGWGCIVKIPISVKGKNDRILYITAYHITYYCKFINWYKVNCAVAISEEKIKTKNYSSIREGWYINMCMKDIDGKGYVITTRIMEVIKTSKGIVAAILFRVSDEKMIISGSIGCITEKSGFTSMTDLLNGLICIGFAKVIKNEEVFAIAATVNRTFINKITVSN